MALNSLMRDDSVNIDEFPTLDALYKVDENAQLTLGDLHGNAKKLLYTLMRHDVFRNLNQNDYVQFVRLYNKDNDAITKADLAWFEGFLNKIAVNPLGTVRLIGDDLADRGSNDYFTLRLLAKLIERTNVEIIISNHSIEFIRAFEKGTPYTSPNLLWGLAASMANLQQLITKGLVTRQEVDSLFNGLYLPKVKLLDCTIDEANQRLAIFSHAPIGIESVQYIAQKMGVTYKDDTLKELAQTIEDINTAFTNNYVNTKQIHTLFDNEHVSGDPAYVEAQTAPFTHLIWNRDHARINRPENYKGYKLKFIHGHDTKPTNVAHRIYNLDNVLGKGSYSSGPYYVHFTHEKALHPKAVVNQQPEPQSVIPTNPTPPAIDNNITPIVPPVSQPQANWKERILNTLKNFAWAPSRYPLMSGMLATAVVATTAFLFAMSIATIAAVSVFAFAATVGSIRARNYIARNAIQNVNESNIALQTQTVQDAFKQGQEAAKGWLPYAKTYNVLNTTPWKDYGAFAAGMKSELDKSANRTVSSI